MKQALRRILCTAVAVVMMLCCAAPAIRAAEVADEDVLAVIAQLEAIDTLQQMQDKRYTYTVKSSSDSNTTNASVLEAHETARLRLRHGNHHHPL